MKPILRATLLALALSSWCSAAEIEITGKLHHIGDSTVSEWEGESTTAPEAPRLVLDFETPDRETTWLLLLVHENLHNDWRVLLDGKPLVTIDAVMERRESRIEVPADRLRAGEHRLVLEGVDPQDDALIGRIRLLDESLADYLHLGTVHVTVLDLDSGEPVPARITVVDAAGGAPELFHSGSAHAATRPGLIYTLGYGEPFELPAGAYTLFATRGTEWSLAQTGIEVVEGQTVPVILRLRREVDTTGFIAADTHIHTLTHSGHGDASMEERVITLAGEGVELAVATDHNHHTDYRLEQEELGLHEHFLAVTGNEITTRIGHLNAFPLDPADTPPDHRLDSWVKLVEEARAHGAQMVVLNHPRWPKPKDTGLPHGPFAVQGLDRATGAFSTGQVYTFDGIELVNSTTRNSDVDSRPRWLIEDWFALLNRGYHVSAVGTSDSHTVGDPVGQGRTYVECDTDDVQEIDIDAVCASFRAGRSSVSLGIFATASLGDGTRMGGMATASSGAPVRLDLRVAAPGWVRPRTAEVYSCGERVAWMRVPLEPGAPTDVTLSFMLPPPRHDAHLVTVVQGDAVTGPYWRTREDFTIAVTNPIFLDADADGAFTAPRELASRLLPRAPEEPAALGRLLESLEPAIGLHLLDLVAAEHPERARALDATVERLAQVSHLWELYREGHPSTGER